MYTCEKLRASVMAGVNAHRPAVTVCRSLSGLASPNHESEKMYERRNSRESKKVDSIVKSQ